MKYFLLLFTSFFCFSFFFNISAQIYPDPKVDKYIKSGIEQIIKQDYNFAETTFNKLATEYPNLPFGKIYLAAVYVTKQKDYAEVINEDYVEKLLDDALKICDNLLKKDKNNLWYNYFKALAEGYYSFFKTEVGSYLSAFSRSGTSVDYYEKCLDIDSTFYEAYVGIGAYNYWKSKYFDWIPFVSNHRLLGIKQLKIGAAKANYSKYFAKNSLMWIYIDRENFKSAITAAENALQYYPGNRMFLWGIARAYEDVNKEKAIQYYYTLLESILNIPNHNGYFEIEIKHKIAQQYFQLGKKNEALDLCNEILSVKNLRKDVKKKLEDRLEDVEDLRDEILDN
ncbi:MAG: hypothetical protein JW866_11305 [Ignavibacteriales bacterium]|nr:hypothetical protein [Ignavibacteriales bacterium]